MNEYEPTSHEGIGHPDEYRSGSNLACEDCRLELEALRIRKAGKGPHLNISWLKNSNAGGFTANQIRDSIYESARKDGRDIARA